MDRSIPTTGTRNCGGIRNRNNYFGKTGNEYFRESRFAGSDAQEIWIGREKVCAR
jgi:hypothetical protein